MLAVDQPETLEILDSLEPLLLVVGQVDRIVVLAEQSEVFFLQPPVSFSEFRRYDISYSQSVASRLVHIGGTDALERRSDFGLSLGRFRRRVDRAVRGQDQMRFLRDQQLALYVDSVGFQAGDLFGEDDRVDHHAVADDVDRAVPENARGNRVQHVLLALEVEGVPCIRAALEPGDHPVGGSEHVHDFPFSLVAPLQA